MNLLDFIPEGRENAIQAKELAKLAGYKDTRPITAEIHRLRKSGNIICSVVEYPHGYFIPANDHEITEFVRSMHGRINEISVAVRPAEQHLTER